MALINRTEEGSEELTVRYDNAVGSFAERLVGKDEECLVFLGAGASIDPDLRLPSGKDLSKDLAKKCKLDWHKEIPLSTIAFYYEALRGRKSLNSFLEKKLDVTRREEEEPARTSKTIRILLDILQILEKRENRNLVITTNYDRLFEVAYRDKFGKTPEVLIYRGGIDANKVGQKLHSGMAENEDPQEWRPKALTCLFKMHGCISEASGHNLVITEEDYINFISNMQSQDPKRRLPTHVSARIKKSPIAFIGYSLSDWNFRVLFKATGEKTQNDRYAVQYLKPSEEQNDQERAIQEAEISFWEKKQVKIINADAALFMEDLLGQVREQIRKPAEVAQ